MNQSKCFSCSQQIAILKCQQCEGCYCFDCDESTHQRLDNHIRNTIPFQNNQHYLKNEGDNQENIVEQIQKKRQEIEQLKLKESQLTKHFQEQLLLGKQKYEKKINDLEQRLQQTQQYMTQINKQIEDEADVDKLQNELEELEKNLKLEIKQAEEEQQILNSKTQKVDNLMDRVKKAIEIEQQQVLKMNEVLGIFKACSEQLQKEKELLMLDNEKLVGEVEIFAKFFDENAQMLEELSEKKKKENEQQ